MLKVHSEPPKPEISSEGPALLALGFRPFFIAAGLAATVLLVVWLGAWSMGTPTTPYYTFIGWHSHEMLFGYTTAIIAGFLLTAVRNWTGVNTPAGNPLALLAILWLAGRILPLFSTLLPAPLIALVDIAFLPAVALAIKPALWQGQQKINRIFVPLLLVMALANLLVHLQALGISTTADRGHDMMLYLVVFLVIMIGGRVIPFFTDAVVPGVRAKRYSSVEIASVATVGALILAHLLFPNPWLVGSLAVAAAVVQAVRITGWHSRGIWKTPILWVLYAGLIWIVIGFLLVALASAGLLGMNLAKHALTVGGVGVLTLGMMSRVALGHTGRPIQPARIIEVAFILLNLAALLRVFAPLLMPERYNMWIHISGGVWVLCFLLFTLIYLPMLIKPRIDGKAG